MVAWSILNNMKHMYLLHCLFNNLEFIFRIIQQRENTVGDSFEIFLQNEKAHNTCDIKYIYMCHYKYMLSLWFPIAPL